ncbi:MAG: LamG domain-containing protein [bacterium]
MLATNFGIIPSSGGNFMLTGWSYGKKITIPASQIDADLTYFPLTVYLDNTNFDFSKAKTDGSDIRFTDKSLNQLKFERKEHASIVTGTNLLSTSLSSLAQSDLNSWNYIWSPTLAYNGNLTDAFAVSLTNDYHVGRGIIVTFTSAKMINYIELTGILDRMAELKVEYWNGSSWVQQSLHNRNYAVSSVQLILNNTTISSTQWRFTISAETSVVTNCYWRELSMYDEVSATVTSRAVYNVQIPAIADATDTEIYMFYGNSSAYNTSIEAWQDQTGKALTYNGNVKLIPYLDGASFDGTGDYLTVTDSSAFTFGTGDFTIECRFKIPSSEVLTLGQSPFYLAQGASANGFMPFGIRDASGTVVSYISGATAWSIASNRAVTTVLKDVVLNWTLVRSGNTWYTFENGIQKSTWTSTDSVTPLNTLYIARCLTDGSIDLECSVHGMRITKGVARYTTTFTPPTSFTIDSASVVICMNFAEAIGATTFIDDCGKTVTTYGNVVKTATSDIVNKRVASFDGTGDYFSLAGHSDFAFGTGDFTVEARVKLSAFNAWQSIFSTRPTGATTGRTDVWCLGISSTGYLYLYSGAMIVQSSASLISLNTIYHLAVARSGTTMKLFINGAVVATNISTSENYTINLLTIGCNNNGDESINGSILGGRITKGTARYTSTFTPPTTFVVDSANVVFCTNFDTIYDANYQMIQHMGTSLIDATGNGNNGSVIGTVVTEDSIYGKIRSMSNGANALSFPASSATLDGAVNFTVLTLMQSRNSTYSAIINKTVSATTDAAFHMGIRGTTLYPTFAFYSDDLDGVAVALNTWKVLVGSYNGSTNAQRLYTDGTTIVNRTATGDLTNTNSAPLAISYASNYNTTGSIMAIGETRISNVTRSDSWIKAESLALKNTLITIVDI